MNRVIRRAFSLRLILLCGISVCALAIAPNRALARPDDAATAPAAATASSLARDAEDFWHFGKIGRYDLAANDGDKVLAAGAEPQAVLKTFEAVASERGDSLDIWFTRWQSLPGTAGNGAPAMKQTATKLAAVLREGYRSRRADPVAIRSNIDSLIKNQRAYDIAVQRLRDSGELAVPFMIDYLRDPAKTQYHGAVRRALTDLGKNAVSPLCAVTNCHDNDLLTTVSVVLGEIGYDAAAPYLARLAVSPDVSPSVRTAALTSLNSLGSDVAMRKTPDLFFDLGEKFYYGTASIAADPSSSISFVWYWSDSMGLYKTDVPSNIFNQLMTMRCAEYSLKLGPSRGDALSLWLAANYQREINLKGATDPTREPDQPSADYYGVSSGVQYLQTALGRALRDRNTPLALRIIVSLQGIVGEKNGMSTEASPLSNALTYGDRLVRFEAAAALAAGLPTRPFDGDARVVPLLAAAFAQTGQPTVLLLLPKPDDVNALTEGLKKQNMLVGGATTADGAVSAAASLPSVDVAIISADLPSSEVEKFLNTTAMDQKLAGAARIIITQTAASPYEQRKLHDPMLLTTQARDAAGLKPVIEEARTRTGAGAFDPAAASRYAVRAGQLLKDIALSNNKVLDISPVEATLLSALTDPRPQIVMLAGDIVAVLPDHDAQIALLMAAHEEKAPKEVRVAVYRDLANQAKIAGNLLNADQTQQLLKTVADAKDLEVRTAAAEACGALNLPADQAKTLIIKQSKQ